MSVKCQDELPLKLLFMGLLNSNEFDNFKKQEKEAEYFFI